MKRTIVAIALCAALPALAADKDGNWEAKKQEQFAKMKDIKVQGMRERIALMQDGLSCVQSAQNQDAMRSCEQRERSAMEQHQQRMKERWEQSKPR